VAGVVTDAADQISEANGLEELYVRTAPAALRLAYFLTGDPGLADDLVQEAFVRVAGRFRHRRVPDDFAAYLRRTIVNTFTSQLRRRRLERAWLARQRREPATTPAHDPTVRDELWLALQHLPERQRAAVVLRYYEDLSERDAAEVLGCSAGALNQLIVRATASLRAYLRGDDR
jgi:RNA polymerase sigma-70 factor (sigma-E family)